MRRVGIGVCTDVRRSAVVAVVASIVAGSTFLAVPSLAASRPQCALKTIQRDGPRKIGMYDYTAVVRLVNPSGRDRRIVSRWDVDGSRVRIRQRVAANAAATVSKDFGYRPHRPRMSLEKCVFAYRSNHGVPHKSPVVGRRSAAQAPK